MQVEEMTREQLLDVVRRLPKTADGVPIYPEMRLWTIYDDGPVRVNWFVRGEASGKWLIDTERGNRSERECYSTREAAEKARAR